MNEHIQKAYQLREKGELDEAARLIANVLNESPKEMDAIFCYGMVLLSAERFGMAANMFARCMELRPDSWEAMTNYALSMQAINQFEEAEQVLTKVLRINPNAPAALNNLGLLHVNLVNPVKAIELCERSLKLNPDQAEAKENIGYAKLMLGDFSGWNGYEDMIGSSKYRKHKPLGKEPYWNGEKGGRLYVKGEQGIGDEISFSSILEDARKDNDIIFDCGEKLEGLFRRSFPEIEVYGTRNNPVKPWRDPRTIDYSCLIGTLAHHY